MIPMAGGDRCRLYLVTPPAILPTFPDTLAAALDAGDVAALQIRLKPLPDDDLKRAVEALRPVAQARGVAVILNDRPDLAVALGCDGAHVGQEDTPALIARKVLGGLTLGVTCHDSRHLAMEAGEAGADYVAFGAFFRPPPRRRRPTPVPRSCNGGRRPWCCPVSPSAASPRPTALIWCGPGRISSP